MSSWQPPQPVPARVALDTSATVAQPSATASWITAPLTPAQRHTVPCRIRWAAARQLVRAVQPQQQRPVRRQFRVPFEEPHQLGRGAGHAHRHESFQHAAAGGHLDVAAVLGIRPLGDLQAGPAVDGTGGERFLVPGIGAVVPGHGHVQAARLEHDDARLLRPAVPAGVRRPRSGPLPGASGIRPATRPGASPAPPALTGRKRCGSAAQPGSGQRTSAQSPIAKMCGSWWARSRWSTRMPVAVERPHPSASSVRGRTPHEMTRRSPSIAEPSSSSKAEKPPSGALCSTPVERALPAIRTPQRRRPAARTAPPPWSMVRPSGCGPLCTTVTVAPSSAAASAVSRPRTPPPRTTTRLPPSTACRRTPASRRSRSAVTPAGRTGEAGSGIDSGEVGDHGPGTGGEHQPVVVDGRAVREQDLLAGAVHAPDAGAQPDVHAVGGEGRGVRQGQGIGGGAANPEVGHQDAVVGSFGFFAHHGQCRPGLRVRPAAAHQPAGRPPARIPQ